VREGLLDLALPAEHLDQFVAGERLLDLGVERAGVRPLRDELLLRALGDLLGDPMDAGTANSAMSVRIGEMLNIIASTPTTVSTDVSSWLSVCCRLCAMLSMSLVTRLSSSPRGCWSK
jgi:hypothetical protein